MKSFSSWVAKKWLYGFNHSYKISVQSRHWKHFYSLYKTDIWSCSSLREAWLKYSWDSGGFDQNSKKLAELAGVLQTAMRTSDENSAFEACLGILRWGGVTSSSTTGWLKRLKDSCSLVSTLNEALRALRAGRSVCFNSSEFLMNSGMTKIYSLADSSNLIIIYDGRVGASLGYLVAQYCREMSLNSIPDMLAFEWGPSRKTKNGYHKRNPSNESFGFSQLGVKSAGMQRHARMIITASAQIKQISDRIDVPVRNIEAALFMVGYELP